MNEKQKKAIGILGVTFAVYITMKYILVYVAPFLVAFLIVRILNPVAVRIQKYKFFQKISKGTILFAAMSLVLGIAGLLLWFLGVRLFAQIRSVFWHIDLYEAKVEAAIDGCCSVINQRFGIQSSVIKEIVYGNIEKLSEKIQAINVTQVVQYSVRYAMVVFEWISVFFVIFVAVLLILKDYDEISGKLQKYPLWQHSVHIGERLWKMAGMWLKAQILIMAAVMAECVAVLWLLHNSYALLVGILIGFLDALPFIGTGTILLPWAAFELFRGNFFYAASYATLFLAAGSTRDFLEPRLLGERLGIYPIVIAVLVYVGICLFGPVGVLFGPLMFLIIREITREWLEV